MYHLHEKTLASYKAKPLIRHHDSSGVPLKATITQLNNYFKANPSQVNVEETALMFYMLNHANSLLLGKFDADEILDDNHVVIADSYSTMGNVITLRMVYYTLLVITREARHLHKSESFYNGLQGKYGSNFVSWHKNIPSGSTPAAEYLRKNTLDMTLGAYVSAITEIFYKGKFSGGYGGKPWGNIADTLRKLVYGEISPEIFTDTAWTLAHNNGPMFNKGMLYDHYNIDLYKILDVQRSGQIPQLIGEGSVSGISDEVLARYKACLHLFPKEFSGYVDWYQVEALGATKTYPKEKTKQVKAHGPSKFVKKEVSHASTPNVVGINKFYVSPTEWVEIKTRKVA